MTTPEQAARDREKQKVVRLTDIAHQCHGDRWSFDADGEQRHILSRRASGKSKPISKTR